MIRTKEKSLSVLIKEADRVFSEFIRQRDSKGTGLLYCFICGRPVNWKNAHCMHFIDRDQMPVRYDELNAHGGCYQCNVEDPKHKLRYLKMMKFHYGDTVVLALNRKAQSLQKFMRHELEDLIADFKERIKTPKK